MPWSLQCQGFPISHRTAGGPMSQERNILSARIADSFRQQLPHADPSVYVIIGRIRLAGAANAQPASGQKTTQRPAFDRTRASVWVYCICVGVEMQSPASRHFLCRSAHRVRVVVMALRFPSVLYSLYSMCCKYTGHVRICLKVMDCFEIGGDIRSILILI
jgi:hypothetical protein